LDFQGCHSTLDLTREKMNQTTPSNGLPFRGHIVRLRTPRIQPCLKLTTDRFVLDNCSPSISTQNFVGNLYLTK
jgi:hypothetical protein